MNQSLENFFSSEIAVAEEQLRTRNLKQIKSLTPPLIEVGSREYISFSSNDSYGLSQHEDVMKAASKACLTGAGAGASRAVTGNYQQIEQLEGALAEFKNADAALLFGSGYLANLGVISALMGKADLILLDKLAHRCLIDGATLSGAEMLRFKHNDMADCERLLKTHRAKYRNCLIVSESVFSMDGDLGKAQELSELAKTYNSWLLLDDAHLLPTEAQKELTQIDAIRTGTCSKMLGSYGGYVCGSVQLKKYLVSHASSFLFTTALPPLVVAASFAALELVENMPSEQLNKPVRLANHFTQMVFGKPHFSHIVPIIFADNRSVLSAQSKLAEYGFWVQAIRYPTVPKNQPRLRLAFSAHHDIEMVEKLAGLVGELF